VDDGAPLAYTALAAGTPVYAADGDYVGSLVEVVDDPEEDIFEGIVVQTTAGRRFVGATEVGPCAERAVRLRIPAADVAKLSAPREARPIRAEDEGDGPPAGPVPVRRMAFGIRGLLPAIVYAVAGSRLPTGLYVAGLVVCVVLLALWLLNRLSASRRGTEDR